MNDTENSVSEQVLSHPPRYLESRLIICIILYLLFFPCTIALAFCSLLVVGSPHIPVFVVWLNIFMMSCVPISIPFSIYFMCSKYSRKMYDSARFFSFLPFYIFMTGQIVFEISAFICKGVQMPRGLVMEQPL